MRPTRRIDLTCMESSLSSAPVTRRVRLTETATIKLAYSTMLAAKFVEEVVDL